MKFIQSVKKRIGSESSSSRDSIDSKSDDSSLKKRVSDKKISAKNSMGLVSPEKRFLYQALARLLRITGAPLNQGGFTLRYARLIFEENPAMQQAVRLS